MKKKIALLAVLIALAAGIVITNELRPIARAIVQDASAQDTWSGHNEQAVCSQPAVGTTTAVVFTAVAGKKMNVRSLIFRVSAAGTVSFMDGTTNTVLYQVYAPQNTDVTLDERLLRGGFITTSGNGVNALCDAAATLVCSGTIRLN